jgi:hypothetical protein
MWEGFASGAGASILSGAASLAGGVMANASSVQSAREQMAFQERMRATQYQTAVKDLQQAGLNPMLAYSQGGAGVPSGAMANIKDAIGPAVSSAVQAYQANAAIKNTEADTENKNESTNLIKSNVASTNMDTELKEANSILANAQTAKVRAEMEESLGRKDLNSTQRQKLQQEIDNIDTYLDAVRASTQRDVSSAEQAKAVTANIHQDTRLNAYDEARLINEQKSESGIQGDIRQLAKTVGLGANAVTSARSAFGRKPKGMSIQQNNIQK